MYSNLKETACATRHCLQQACSLKKLIRSAGLLQAVTLSARYSENVDETRTEAGDAAATLR